MKVEKVVVNDPRADAKNGQDKCSACGSTDISLNPSTGNLRCNFCRHEELAEKIVDPNTKELDGHVISAGAQNIQEESNELVTLKCTSCGTEVVIDTKESAQARCHWCRNYLSINEQIPNGAIPDAILPFNVTKEAAQQKITEFVGKRRFYALPQFKKEFTVENIMGVYFPYMLVDAKAHADFKGEGEVLLRSYLVQHGKTSTRYYDAAAYRVQRIFDITVDDLPIEANADKLNFNAAKTNNIINTIMPFDTENCVHWNANYLRGYSSEKRNINISVVENRMEEQLKDVARHSINSDLRKYDRGISWKQENFEIQGEYWKATYLPVWLYSYQQKKATGNMIHYLAVNGRTLEVMGSVPIDHFKLFMVSAFLELLSVWFWWVYLIDEELGFIVMAIGFIYYGYIYMRYRNAGERHHHEYETKKEVSNIERDEVYIGRRNRLSNSQISGANNYRVDGRAGTDIQGALFQKINDIGNGKGEDHPFLG